MDRLPSARMAGSTDWPRVCFVEVLEDGVTQTLIGTTCGPPPSVEVRQLWERCVPVTSDDEVYGWLDFLHVDPHGVAALDLGRALPRTMEAPRWATYGATSWQA